MVSRRSVEARSIKNPSNPRSKFGFSFFGFFEAINLTGGVDEGKWKMKNGNGTLEERKILIAEREGEKIRDNLEKKVKEKGDRRLVAVGAVEVKDLTVIDGVHRAIRICLYYMVRRNNPSERISEQAYLGFTSNPVKTFRGRVDPSVRFFLKVKPRHFPFDERDNILKEDSVTKD